jgi:hypothetical protein
MLVAALVLEGLAPGAAPVGGVPRGGVMPDGVVTVDDVLSQDVAADCVEEPTDTASIRTIRSERVVLLIMRKPTGMSALLRRRTNR